MRGHAVSLEDGETVVFGRAKECRKGAMPHEDLTIARHQFAIRVAGARVHVWDLNSPNGTWVNGRRLPRPSAAANPRNAATTPMTRLQHGDQIRAGETTFVVHFRSAASRANRPAPACAACGSPLTPAVPPARSCRKPESRPRRRRRQKRPMVSQGEPCASCPAKGRHGSLGT